MTNLRWDGDDFRNEQDSSGSTANLVSNSGKLQQGYQHGSLTEGLVAYYPMERGEGLWFYSRALTPAEIEKLYNRGAYRISRGDTLQ